MGVGEGGANVGIACGVREAVTVGVDVFVTRITLVGSETRPRLHPIKNNVHKKKIASFFIVCLIVIYADFPFYQDAHINQQGPKEKVN
jgi:hypothetical protein